MTYTNNFDGLVQFKTDVIEPLTRGASLDEVDFAPGYRELYEQWTAVVGDALIKMNPDDRLNSFTDYIREENKRFEDKYIKRMVATPGEKKLWRQAAARGQVVRVSDDAEHFNKLVRSDQLRKLDSSTNFVLSDTCRSTTNDWQEVCDEQSALLITGKLREQHFLVQRAESGRVFKAEVVHAKTGVYSVEVDLRKPFTEILSFSFRNGQGESKVISMSEIGEAYDTLKSSISGGGSVLDLAAEAAAHHITSNKIDAQHASRIQAGALAALAAAASKKKNLPQEGVLPQTVLPNGMSVPNVQAAKSDVKARMEAAQIAVTESREEAKKAHTQYKESLHAAAQYRDEVAEKRARLRQKDKKNQGHMLKAAGAATAASGLGSLILGWIAM